MLADGNLYCNRSIAFICCFNVVCTFTQINS